MLVTVGYFFTFADIFMDETIRTKTLEKIKLDCKRLFYCPFYICFYFTLKVCK